MSLKKSNLLTAVTDSGCQTFFLTKFLGTACQLPHIFNIVCCISCILLPIWAPKPARQAYVETCWRSPREACAPAASNGTASQFCYPVHLLGLSQRIKITALFFHEEPIAVTIFEYVNQSAIVLGCCVPGSSFLPSLQSTFISRISLRSWRYCVVVEWDLAAEPL